MASETVTGIVLSSQNIGETDRRIVLLTRERGKISVFARGAVKPKNPLVTASQPFTFGEFFLYAGRDSYTVTGAEVKNHFPADLASSETADLFMSVIMYRLKKNGRAAVILQDGFLFGTDNAKVAIKKKLLSEFNLHTVIRMPHSVFAPYTSITTNILFFDHTKPTEETWFYRLDMPEGYKNFSKTKAMELKHFEPAIEWWNNREEINVDGFDKAKKYTAEEIVARNYNIDLCGYPHEEEEILPPKELIQQYQEKRASLNADIDRILAQITEILGIDLEEE